MDGRDKPGHDEKGANAAQEPALDHMTAERISIYDTTLRDGAQTQGVDFSAADKAALARVLDGLGIDYVEGGWPGANPTDDAFFASPPQLKHARLAAFGMTRRSGRSAANDPGLAATLASGARVATLVGKTWDFHVKVALGAELAENVDMIAESIAHLRQRLDEVIFDAEHFFDGWKASRGYALDCVKAARDAGARWVVLCDTNGGVLPDEVERIVAEGRDTDSRRPPRHPLATTTPRTRWRIPLAGTCARARGRCRARSTALASAAATRIWSP